MAPTAQPEAPVPSPTAEPANPRGMLFRLLLVVGVGLIAGASVGGLYLGPMVAPLLPAPAEAEAHAPEGEGEASAVHVIDNLVVNPAGSGGTRILLTSVAVETSDTEQAARMPALDVELRAALIVVLGAKTVEDLTDVTQRGAISQEVFDEIERVMGEGSVKRILIPQFVVQ